jgi:hypothetical protein
VAALDPASAPAPTAATSVAAMVASHRLRGWGIKGPGGMGGRSPSCVEGDCPRGAGSRFGVLATAIAVGLSVALELTGPPRPFLFSLRLPLIVLLIGAAWTQAPAWMGARWPGDVARSRKSVPMATPVLILTSTAGVAAVTAKLVSLSPGLACAAFSVASAACCLAVGLLLTGGRRRRAPRPDDGAVPLAESVPGQPVGAVGVDVGGEFGFEDQRP